MDMSAVTGPLPSQEWRGRYLNALLRGMNNALEAIEAAAVVSRDGVVIASVSGTSVDPETCTRLCTGMAGLADRMASEMERGHAGLVLVEAEMGSMLLVRADANTSLVVAARPKANLSVMLRTVRDTALKIQFCSDGSRLAAGAARR